MLALTSPTSGGRSVSIVHSRTKAQELVNKEKIHKSSVKNSTIEVVLFTLLHYEGKEKVINNKAFTVKPIITIVIKAMNFVIISFYILIQ
jgi:hypothetical protein